MIRSLVLRAVASVAIANGALSVTACSGDAQERQSESTAIGTLSMPLVAVAGEHTYRLQGSLLIDGPQFTFLDLGTDTDVVTTSLATGAYSANLYYWSLLRNDGAGNFSPVSATLVSSSYAYFTIFNQSTTTVAFEFETDGQLVTVGAGTLNIEVQVNETPAQCTVFGSDCPSGTWCAPPELTGGTLSCISEGPLALGEACSSPQACTANTSCFDFGSGSFCAALCPSADFDQPCSSGGTCLAQGTDYGVCAPDGATP